MEEEKGYAIFNVQKSTTPIKTLDIEVPITIFKKLEAKF